MFLLVTEDVRMIGGNIGCDILLAVVKKLFFFHLLAKFCQRSETVGGYGGLSESLSYRQRTFFW